MIFAVSALAAPVWTPLTPEQSRAFAVAEISSSGGRVCARSTTGQVACWGDQFMYGKYSWKPPTGVPQRLEGIDDAVDIVVGSGLYVLRDDGTVTLVRDSRQLAQAGFTDIVEIDKAYNGVCGRRKDGAVLCHGWVDFAKTDDSKARPLGLKKAVGLSCGVRGCCSWTAEGDLACVGHSDSFDFGTSPKRPKGAPSDVVDVQLGLHTACATTREGSQICWGGDPAERYPDVWKPPKGAKILPSYPDTCWLDGDTLTCIDGWDATWSVSDVAALWDFGDYAHCVTNAAGALSCWGSNEYGSLADGKPMHHPTPQQVPGVKATRISAAYSETCAVSGSDLLCWGRRSGTPRRAGKAGKVGVVAQYLAGCQIDFGMSCVYPDRSGGYERDRFSGTWAGGAMDRGTNVCGFDAKGEVSCMYSLGEGGMVYETEPLAVPERVTAIAPLSVGFVFLGKSGTVYEWQDHRFDHDDDFVDAPKSKQKAKPVGVDGAIAITAHQNGGCAATKAGPVKCWGGIGFGYDYAGTGVATIPGFDGATQLSGNHFHVCGIVGTEVRCFGDNEYGQLGYATEGEGSGEARPVPLPGPARQVAVGADHSCALLQDERVFCWGRDHEGQVGVGRTVYTERPVPTVLGPGAVIR